MMDFGRSASVIFVGLYASTVERAAIPTHRPVDGA
jgi:hypothetical protein